MKKRKYLFLITAAYFLMGFVSIYFAMLALICMVLPIVLLMANNKKIWCQEYCPRASLFTVCAGFAPKHSRKTPDFLINGSMKWIVLGYFLLNLVLMAATAIMVASGMMPPMNNLRFLFFIPIPFGSMQLVTISNVTPWITHLSYMVYSMMATTTFIGLVLGLIYRARTWCVICPVSTVSNLYLDKRK